VKTLNHQTIGTVQVQPLLRWRWIILFASIAFVATVEALEHQELELHLAREFLLYGMVIPIGTWFLLTLLAHHMARQVALTDELEELHQFSRQLAYYQDRDELAQYIVRFPSANMPVQQVSLFLYDHQTTQMEFIAEWNSDAQNRPTTCIAPISADAAYVRILSKTPGLHEATLCPLISTSAEKRRGSCFCLPLVHDSILVGVLQLQCHFGQQFTQAQMQFLNALSPQIAVALALSIAFPRQLTEAHQAERRRLSYELHDSLAQQIGFLHLSLDRLADDERLTHAEGLQHEVEKLREVADEVYLQIRNNLNLLRQQDSTELVAMIDSHIRSIAAQVPFEIQFTVTGKSRPLGPLTTRQVYSLIQESLNNIQKHAQAHVAWIKLAWHSDRLDVTVTDDGTGFEVSDLPDNGRYGLIMLRERSQNLQGEMRVTSRLGVGTALQFEIPLPAH